MAEKSARNPAVGASADPALKAMGDMQQNAVESLNWFGSAWLEAWGAMGKEVSEFVAERIREDIRTQHAMLNCKSAEELHAIQSAFVQTAIDQYTAETGKLVSLQQEFLDRVTKIKPD